MLYHRLETMDANPVIKLNLAVAPPYSETPQTELSYLDMISGIDQLANYHPYHAARANMFHRDGQFQNAAKSHLPAISHCNNDSEKIYLQAKMQACLKN